MPTFRVFDIDAIPTTQDLLNEFLVNVVCTSNGLTDIAIGSKLWTIGYALARQHASIYYTLHFYRKQSFVLTATGRYLDLHGQEAGVLRHQANPAGGEATFYRVSPAPMDILIPAGTTISTPIISSDVQPIRFRTQSDAVVKVGTTSIAAIIECTQSGLIGNLPSGAITRIETVLSGAQAVSTTSTSGGLEIETDDSYRLRIMTAWAARETGTTAAIRNAILSIQGIRNVMIVDPARLRVKQSYTVTASISGKPQVLLETQGLAASKYDIWLTLDYDEETVLTLTIEQVDDKGSIIAKETVPFIDSGWDLINKINNWTQSSVLYLNSLKLDDNPYDDPNKQATDNEIVSVKTISPETRFEKVFVNIQDKPSSDEKRLIVSTYAQYRHNEILGQTEVSPLVEVFSPLGTYENMVNKINNESKLIQMELLEVKTATQLVNPVPYQGAENNVFLDFIPVVEILSPVDARIRIIDDGSDSQSEKAIVGVGDISAPINVTYKYRASVVTVLPDLTENRISFGGKTPEDVITALSPDGSEIIAASVIFSPGTINDIDYAYCSEVPQRFARTQMKSYYELIRGRIDVTVIPYTLTEIPSATLLAQVVAAVERVRPAGVEVNIIWPETIFVDFEVMVEISTGSINSPSDFYDIITNNITNYINSLDMGEPAYTERIIAAANPNVSGLKVTHLLNPTVDIIVPSGTFLRAGKITFAN